LWTILNCIKDGGKWVSDKVHLHEICCAYIWITLRFIFHQHSCRLPPVRKPHEINRLQWPIVISHETNSILLHINCALLNPELLQVCSRLKNEMGGNLWLCFHNIWWSHLYFYSEWRLQLLLLLLSKVGDAELFLNI
jgi:hypothetical protein